MAKYVLQGIEDELVHMHHVEDEHAQGQSEYRGSYKPLRVKKVQARTATLPGGVKMSGRCQNVRMFQQAVTDLGIFVTKDAETRRWGHMADDCWRWVGPCEGDDAIRQMAAKVVKQAAQRRAHWGADDLSPEPAWE